MILVPDFLSLPLSSPLSSPLSKKIENTERLNLDRVNLIIMPLLEGEHRLRLLNYQNNCLKKICHLQGLPNLIFLDLYNNSIERIEGLACVCFFFSLNFTIYYLLVNLVLVHTDIY